jgi:hypothetical protein
VRNFQRGDIVRVDVDYDIDPGIWIAGDVSVEEVNALLDSIGALAMVHDVGPDWATIITSGNDRITRVPNAYLKFVCGL